MNRLTAILLVVIGALGISTTYFAYEYYTTYALLERYADTLVECLGKLLGIGEDIYDQL